MVSIELESVETLQTGRKYIACPDFILKNFKKIYGNVTANVCANKLRKQPFSA